MLENRKVKSLGLYILILLNLLLLPFYSTRAQDAKGGIIDALNSLELSIEEINVNAHVNMSKQFLDSPEAEALALEIAEDFLVEKFSIDNYSTGDSTEIILQGSSEKLSQVTVIVQGTDLPDITETNIVVDVISNDSFVNMTTLEEKIQRLLASYGKVNLYSNVTAFHKEKLSVLEQKEMIGNLMKKLEAKEVELFTDNDMVSITGYSSLIKEWKQYGGNKVNLNIAMRYNSFEEKTNLWVGTPFITTGY